MPCHATIDQNSICVKQTETIETIVALMQERGQSIVAVENEDGVFEGVFSLQTLMKNSLPVSVAMNDGVQMDIKVPAAPGIAKRLDKVLPLPVQGFIDRQIVVIRPDTAIWQGVSLLIQHGEPLVVVDTDKQTFVGFMTFQTAYAELNRLKESEE